MEKRLYPTDVSSPLDIMMKIACFGAAPFGELTLGAHTLDILD